MRPFIGIIFLGGNFVRYIQALKIAKFFYPVISFLAIYLKKITMNFHKDLHIMTYITALFILAE